eukprot:TRINITY_DN36174_c0_g1_i1.p1 TRINITY_DN36174_c0_g1~~TRINITY_DN36174_c0_g1_i1.p1  ORF type:complete len:106 (+),score=7.88 TRINITY_DN36174_c0_g1_i1:98-415(+)
MSLTGDLFTTFAGMPATVQYGSTALFTTAEAATTHPFPILMLPNTWQCAPRITSSPILGCLSPPTFPVAPNVMSCKNCTFRPTTAVLPMTSPVPWSRVVPVPSSP